MRWIGMGLAMVVALRTATGFAQAEPVLEKEEAQAALRKAVGFFREHVAIEGGYLWRYSADLSKREGEGKVETTTTVWVQPPGTPAIGAEYLAAYERTGDTYYLEAARETAGSLIRGQLRSGGWDYRIEFAPERRKEMAYRATPCNPEGKNVTTLDDNTTQSALSFLIRLDRALGFSDVDVHECVVYGLESLLKAQYPNGAWPQRYSSPPDSEQFPVKKASYPETWSRKYEGIDYRGYYTFNDNSISDAIRLMFLAAVAYDAPRYRAAGELGGEFILLAQMPDPQPAWAQQYDAEMHPAWARKFEPPAVTGGESQGIMRTLLDLYTWTGDTRYLDAVERALAYLKESQLPDGRLARFYELRTNKPLYFTKDYQLTYGNADMPTHYAFIVANGLARIEATCAALRPEPFKESKPDVPKPEPERMTSDLAKQAREAVDGLDDRGAWVTTDKLRYHGDDDPTTEVIECRTFVENIRVLSRFLEASK